MLTVPPPTSFGQRLARAALGLLGWRAVCPPGLPAKAVVVAYPHTSNWDFLYGMLGRFALGLDVRWIGKDSLFRWPVAGLLRAWGGIPVNRSRPEGFVDQMAARFAASPELLLAIAPEGTRRLTAGWKSGFYRIALTARVPLLLAGFDYGRRQVGIFGTLEPSGESDVDLVRIAAVYAGYSGRRPDQAAPVRLLPSAPPEGNRRSQ